MDIKKILIIEYALIGLLAVFVLYLYRGAIYKQLKEWKVVPLPETFTELYFTKHLELPTTISAGQNQTFEFTISNLEEKTMIYNWVVYAVVDNSYVFKETSQSLMTAKQKNKDITFIETTESTQSEEGSATNIDDSKKILLASGRETIMNKQQKNIPVTIKMDQVFARQKIVVELADMDQTIHYWVEGR